jgi:transposase
MLEKLSGKTKIYIACGYTDLRLQIDGLAALVQTSFALDPCQDALFLFCGRRRDRIKGLLWEGDGFCWSISAWKPAISFGQEQSKNCVN